MAVPLEAQGNKPRPYNSLRRQMALGGGDGGCRRGHNSAWGNRQDDPED
jgi:hypothetical protein